MTASGQKGTGEGWWGGHLEKKWLLSRCLIETRVRFGKEEQGTPALQSDVLRFAGPCRVNVHWVFQCVSVNRSIIEQENPGQLGPGVPGQVYILPSKPWKTF